MAHVCWLALLAPQGHVDSPVPEATGRGLFGNRFKRITDVMSAVLWLDGQMDLILHSTELYAFQDH